MKKIITTIVMAVALTGLTGTVFANGADEQLTPENVTKDAKTITPPINEDDKNKDETSSKDDTQVHKSDNNANQKTGMPSGTYVP